MKKVTSLVLALILVLTTFGTVLADKPVGFDSTGKEIAWVDSGCRDIQSGLLLYPASHYLSGQPLKTGFDVFGYNYQAHMFRGRYVNAYFGGDGLPPYEGDDVAYLAITPGAVNHWAWPYRNDFVEMKWNDAWMANVDCDADGKLDRHFGFSSYRGSGAWETNHMSGTDTVTGEKYVYFVKISAVPYDAFKLLGVWYTSDGVEIGPDIWGEFATTQEVQSGSGVLYVSPFGPGFGHLD